MTTDNTVDLEAILDVFNRDMERMEKAIRKLAMETANLDVLEILDGKENDDEAGN